MVASNNPSRRARDCVERGPIWGAGEFNFLSARVILSDASGKT
jgi:hypothetical protein